MTLTVTRRTIIVGKPTTLGERLRLLRAERNWTLRDLEQKSGISNAFLSQVENGKSNISLNHAATLALLFNTTLDYIAWGRGRKVYK